MVATKGLEEIVTFVKGDTEIPASSISPEAWVRILRAAVKEMPMSHLRGMKTISEAITFKPTDRSAVARRTPSALPRIWLGNPSTSREVPHNRAFLVCEELGNFPKRWEEAPRTMGPSKNGAPIDELAIATCDYLLLSRKGEFNLLHTEWTPYEDWDDEFSQRPFNFFYTLKCETSKFFNIRELSDEELAKWLALADQTRVQPDWGKRPVAALILQRMYLAVLQTTQEMEGQCEYVRRQQVILEGYRSRVGEHI